MRQDRHQPKSQPAPTPQWGMMQKIIMKQNSTRDMVTGFIYRH